MAANDSGVDDTSTDTRRGAGGTPGGLGEFFAGLAMAVAGGYLLLNQVTVTSGFWQFGGYNAFGISLIPLLIGIAMLFFDGRSKLGWVLTVVRRSRNPGRHHREPDDLLPPDQPVQHAHHPRAASRRARVDRP